MIALLAALALAQSAPLEDEAALRAHLCAGAPSPLDALSPGGRRRFLASLTYGERGLGGFSFRPLTVELTEAKGRAVLGLFGADAYADGLTFEGPGATITADRTPPPAAYCEGAVTRGEWLAPSDTGALQRAANELKAALAAADALAFEAEGRQDAAPKRREAHAAYGIRTLPSNALAEASVWTLRDMLSATLRYARHTDDLAALADASALLAALEPRGVPTEADAGAVHDAYLLALDGTGAAALRTRYPEADWASGPFPDRSADPVRTVYVSSGPVARSFAVPDDFTGVLVVASPRCGFSRRMLEAVTEAPDVAGAMADGGLLVLPPGEDGTEEGASSWNAANPALPYHAVRARADWPEVGVWATPSFYRYESGAVVDSMIGWPRGEEEARLGWLRAALEEAR